MPFYEFDCSSCDEPFEKLLRSYSQIDSVTCPSCGSPKVTKKLSIFAVKGTRTTQSGGSTGPAANCAPGGT